MQRKTFLHLQIKWKRVSLIVIALFLVLQPFNLFGEETKQEVISKIEIKDGLINADLKDADLPEVLKEIEKGTGVKISIVKEIEGKKVTTSFKNLDVENALRKILGNNYVFMFSKEKDKYVLKEVMTAGVEFGSKISKGKMITIDIPYGKGKREVGAVKAGEGANIGPLSFAVDDEGNIYICDTVNGRIQIFSSEGKYLSTIYPKEHMVYETEIGQIYSNSIQDIAVDEFGFIYIYDDLRRIYQYDRNGNVITSVEADKKHRWKYDGKMYIVNDNIYIDTCDYGDVCGHFLIGKTVRSTFTQSTNAELKKVVEKGIYGLSGKRYLIGGVETNENKMGMIDIIDSKGITKTISFPLKKGTILTEFLGEDRRGNLYVKSHRDEDKKGVVDVHKLSTEGNYLSTIKMPESKIFFRSIKNYAISKNGNIYQFLPEKDNLKLNIFTTEK